MIESGVTVKGRRNLPNTLPSSHHDVYGHARTERLSQAVERVAQATASDEPCVTFVSQAVGAEPVGMDNTTHNQQVTAQNDWWMAAGIEHSD